VKANDLSSSARNLPELDLLSSGRLPSIPSAWLKGSDLDLLEPLRFLSPGSDPQGEPPAVDRRELAEALEVANTAYAHPAAGRLSGLLADPQTRVVVTGQQPGLWGGPLLGLDKMIAAQLWAERLTAAGKPAVAVFWVATEDHDWKEMARASLLGRKEVRQFTLGEDPAPLMPLGMRTFGDSLHQLNTEAEGLLGGGSPGLAQMRRWFRSDARFGEAFSRLMVSLLGERTPLMFDSMLPEIKRLQRPWLRRFVDRRTEVEDVMSAREGEIVGRGFPLQVNPQPGASPLFLLRGNERRRIQWTSDGESYVLRGLEEDRRPLAELYDTLEENPAVVSPGVLARPAVQDALLGTTLQVMGPSEMSYMSQVSSIYPTIGITPPWTTLRPQALVLEGRQIGYLEELGVSLEELFDMPVERLVADKLGEDFVQPVRQQVETLMAALREPLLALDPTLERPWRKTNEHIGRNLEQLSNKVAAAISRKHDVWRQRFEGLRRSCLPAGHLQERELAVLYYLDRYGPRFAEDIAAQMQLDPRFLRVLQLDRGGWPAPAAQQEGPE
jgi:bacillithiol biosynthesis cysteine-adding enzyme BshC